MSTNERVAQVLLLPRPERARMTEEALSSLNARRRHLIGAYSQLAGEDDP
ncbi:hypothetical protein [Sorangium cellulosum]|nr:hypothetical protein [Sorangium cellulosum]